MKKLTRALRMAGLIAIMLVASFAVGMAGHFLPITRERYQNKGITTEQVIKKREEDEPELQDD